MTLSFQIKRKIVNEIVQLLTQNISQNGTIPFKTYTKINNSISDVIQSSSEVNKKETQPPVRKKVQLLLFTDH